MSNDEWLSTREASRILRLSERQTNRYGEIGRLKRKRIGRKVFYLRRDVEALADELGTADRQMPVERKEPDTRLLDYLQERDEQYRAGQQEIVHTQRQIEERLGRLEQHMQANQPRVSWQVVAALALVVAIGLIVLAVVYRLVT